MMKTMHLLEVDGRCQMPMNNILARLRIGWRLVLSFNKKLLLPILYVCWGDRGEAAGHLKQLTSVTCFHLARSIRPVRYV